MDYLDYEIHSYFEMLDSTCDECGGCILEEYYDCTCEEEDDDDIMQQINYQR